MGSLQRWRQPAVQAERLSGAYPVATGDTAAEPSSPDEGTALRLLPIADVTIEPGKKQTIVVRIERRNCAGPIELRLQGLPAGVKSGPAFVAADGDVGHLELSAEP